MKQLFIPLFLGTTLLIAENAPQKDEQVLILSEAFGHFVGSNLQNPGIAFDTETFIKGVRKGAAGEPAPLSEDEYKSLMDTYQASALKRVSEENLKDTNAFFKDNASKTGVVEIEKGLQYQILSEGEGEAVIEDSSPLLHITCQLMDGTIIASTKEEGTPTVLPLNQANTALQLGIPGMRVGEKRRLFVHPDYGYGSLESLPPNTLLIFDVEVVQTNNQDEIGSLYDEMISELSDEELFLEEMLEFN